LIKQNCVVVVFCFVVETTKAIIVPPPFYRERRRMLKRSYDVVVVGGGVMGSSIAYHLSKLTQGAGGKKLSIAVIEKDKKYLTASAMLSAGGLRQQFSVAENTLMSMYGAEFLKSPETLQVNDCVPDYQVIRAVLSLHVTTDMSLIQEWGISVLS
jgi:FAD-dependent oxidoreductase domain-containing protein 1